MAATGGTADIALPGGDGYAEAASVFNLAAPARPAAAVTARTVEDVQAAIRAASARGLTVRVHTTGHAAAGVPPVAGAILIKTKLAGGVEVDAGRRIARIPAGTTWGGVIEATAPHRLTAVHGSSGNVGVVGYLLRGGLSFYGRKFGLAANSVRAVELVTADAELRRADAATDPELFWALRGGGGGLGVVTAVEIDLIPAGLVITGAAFWPAGQAERIMRTWLRWTAAAPPEATTSVRVMNLPPVPEVPPALADGPVVCVDGAVLSQGEDSSRAIGQADELLGPLRSIAEPLLDTWQAGPPTATLHAHLDPTEPVPFIGDHMLLGDIGEEGAAAFLKVTGEGSGSPLIEAGLRQLGGALATPDPAGGVLNHLPAHFSYAGSGVPVSPEQSRAVAGYRGRVRSALRAWDTRQTVPCFVEDYRQPQGHLTAQEVTAVDLVRLRVDPAGLFRGDIAPGATAL